MEWAALPNPLGAVLGFVGQAIPPSGSGTGWIEPFLTATGPAGAVAAVLWLILQRAEKRHETERTELRAENRQLTSRLFILADRGMAVGQTASEVVSAEAKASDPALLAEIQRLRALLEARGLG